MRPKTLDVLTANRILPLASVRDVGVTAAEGSCKGLTKTRGSEKRAQEAACPMSEPDRVSMWVLYTQTVNRLEYYQAQVAQVRELDAANDFARYVLNANLGRILAPYDSQTSPKIDSSHLTWLAKELRQRVCDLYSQGKAHPETAAATLESIHHKLDLIAAHVAGIYPKQEPGKVVAFPEQAAGGGM